MNDGDEVLLPTVKAYHLVDMLSNTTNCNAEVYIRIEDGKAILYAVKREDEVGTILCSKPIPFLPE